MATKFLGFVMALIALTSAVQPLHAHEAHRKDMSDAEMAEMKEREAQEAAAHSQNAETLSPGKVSDEAQQGAVQEEASTHHEEPSLLDILSALHPAAVHFPIALFLMAGLAELMLVFRPVSGLEPTVRFLVYTGTAGGAVATFLGWLAAGMRMSDRSETLFMHRWTGTGIMALGIVASLIAARQNENRNLLRLFLAVICFILVFQGYWGAEMSHGPNHLG